MKNLNLKNLNLELGHPEGPGESAADFCVRAYEGRVEVRTTNQVSKRSQRERNLMASSFVFRQFLALLMLFVMVAAVSVLATTEEASGDSQQRRELLFGGVVTNPDDGGDTDMLYGLPLKR